MKAPGRTHDHPRARLARARPLGLDEADQRGGAFGLDRFNERAKRLHGAIDRDDAGNLFMISHFAPYAPSEAIAFKIDSGVQGASSRGWPPGLTACTASRIAE